MVSKYTNTVRKINMKKIIKFFLTGAIFTLLLFGFFLGKSGHISLNTPANAQVTFTQGSTQWGACNSDPNYQKCPATGTAISSCIDSAGFKITVNNVGTAIIPPGSPVSVHIAPADGSTWCSEVTCLKRVTDYPTTWAGGNTLSLPLFDQIGCATNGTCTNSYLVTFRFTGTNLTFSCPNSDATVPVSPIRNGQTANVTMNLNCTPLVTPTPTPPTCPVVPTVIPTITCPNCQ